MPEITVYGAPWCSDCKPAKQFLGEQRIEYNWVDIDGEPQSTQLVREKNNGRRSSRRSSSRTDRF